MRNLIDLIKSLENNDQRVQAELTVDPVDVKSAEHDLEDEISAINGQIQDADVDYQFSVDADTVTGRSDSDDVHYVGDPEADVSQNKRNNVRKYGRRFQN